ncbi:MAG: hypothetical protein IJF08_02195 [Clostridia bacterium]|nr:hypothetical protein [Clostridia bacterium]
MITVTQTDHLRRMKVWVEPFQRLAGRGQSPRRARRREFFLAVFLVLFLRLLAQKKNGENFINVTHPNPSPAFFFDTAGAKKKAWQRRNAENMSRLRARLGALPQVPATIFKKGRSKNFTREVVLTKTKPQGYSLRFYHFIFTS